MTDNERFEVRAETFRIMTGHMAPGKDPSVAAYEFSYKERLAVFNEWINEHDKCVRAMLLAFERVLE